MATIRNISDNNTIAQQIGNMVVQTTAIPMKGEFLTLVVRDNLPFDMAVSKTTEEARNAHQAFLDAAYLMVSLEEEIGSVSAGLLN